MTACRTTTIRSAFSPGTRASIATKLLTANTVSTAFSRSHEQREFRQRGSPARLRPASERRCRKRQRAKVQAEHADRAKSSGARGSPSRPSKTAAGLAAQAEIRKSSFGLFLSKSHTIQRLAYTVFGIDSMESSTIMLLKTNCLSPSFVWIVSCTKVLTSSCYVRCCFLFVNETRG